MKKYFLIPIIVSLLFTVSCDDQLERFPVDSLVEETAYQSVNDLEAGLRGAINSINRGGGQASLLAFNSIFTDNARLGGDNGGQQLNLLNQILNSQTGDQGTWGDRYNAINNFNRVLAGASTITPSAADTDRYNNVLAQCYAFRAYLHHDLLTYYAEDLLNPSSLGVFYQNTVSTSDLPARQTVGEVLTEIENDLTLAASLMPSSSTDKNYATLDFITFLRARVALYSGDYNTAITNANTLISSYSLANQTQYAAMFNGDTDTTEVIFKFDNVQGNNASIAFNWIFTGTGGNFIEMSTELFNAFAIGDVRRSVAVDPSSDPGANPPVLTIGKYPAGADTNYINDYKAMRLSEMYLIRAEAHARKAAPDFAAAAADVNAIRTARFGSAQTTATYTSLNQAIADIKDERRLELCFEGFRYLDIKRYRNILNEGIERDAFDCQGGVPCSLPVSSEKFTFPIPQTEINANPNMVQNSGY
ncbi:RagB/SusD family nutrient uptake outer membrane protein [Kordia zhangzhouensis]|uniref:RagB/SusD family nutrient uptake outer membrane protein n=1 Tax=Kordia zhangzhouensis TaxID=1620405 RepID=UPI0006293098|nr:RagB/SusD family nutrient uptake outer membrane protein [Kordia zhangzhouensis]